MRPGDFTGNWHIQRLSRQRAASVSALFEAFTLTAPSLRTTSLVKGHAEPLRAGGKFAITVGVSVSGCSPVSGSAPHTALLNGRPPTLEPLRPMTVSIDTHSIFHVKRIWPAADKLRLNGLQFPDAGYPEVSTVYPYSLRNGHIVSFQQPSTTLPSQPKVTSSLQHMLDILWQ